MSSREYYAAPSPDAHLHIRYVGEEDCTPGHRFGGVRDHFLFHYILDGEGSVRANGNVYPVKRGGGFVFFPGQRHEYRSSREHPWRYAWIGFNGTLAGELLELCSITRERPVFSLPFSMELSGLFHRCAEEMERPSPWARLAGDGYLRLILGKLIACYRALDPEGEREVEGAPSRVFQDRHLYAAAARRFMEDHYSRSIQTSHIARFVGIDRAYLSRLFKEEFGFNLKEFLTAFRMERAKELLREGNLSIAQVAASVGYRDRSVFARRYKAFYGQSPGMAGRVF